MKDRSMELYETFLHKIPQESPDYPDCSEYVVSVDDFIRREYLEKHIEWFLKNHRDQEPQFRKDVEHKYDNVASVKTIQQYSLFDSD